MKSTSIQKSQSKRILAVHGFTGEPYDFAALYESGRLDVDWRFVVLPGHFREFIPQEDSAKWDYFCARIEEIVIEAEADEVELIGLGYSMGARLLLRAQLERKWDFSKLIFIGVTPGIENDKLRCERTIEDKKWASLLRESGIDAFVDAWMVQPIISTQQISQKSDSIERIQRKRLLHPNFLAQALLDYSNGTLVPVWKRLCELSLPVHLVCGETDSKFLKIHEQMLSELPRGAIHSIPNAGHAPHLESEEEFICALSDILKS